MVAAANPSIALAAGAFLRCDGSLLDTVDVDLTSGYRQLDSVYMNERSDNVSQPVGIAATEPSRALWLYAALALVGSLVTGLLLVLDPRELAGEPLWLKPTKFFLSSAIAALTIDWVVRRSGLRSRRLEACRVIIAWGFGLEMLIICGQAARGVRSHFNLSTPIDAGLFTVMGLVITGVVVAMAVAVVTASGGASRLSRVERNAARWGIGIFVAAAFLGNLMVRATPSQAARALETGGPGLRGSHFVGSEEGLTRTMPATGWSRDSGDLRVPHFVGMHAMQALLLLALLLRKLGMAMDDSRTVWRMTATGVGLGLLWALTLAQALAGRSLLDPGPWWLGLLLVMGGLVGTVVSLLMAPRRKVEAA